MVQVTTEQSAFESLGPNASSIEIALKRQAYLAAEAYVSARCDWPDTDGAGSVTAPPPALVQAVNLLTARYLERRNSPSGVLGGNDFGVVRISGSDRDVDALIAPWRKRILG